MIKWPSLHSQLNRKQKEEHEKELSVTGPTIESAVNEISNLFNPSHKEIDLTSNLNELESYSLYKPYAYVKILRDSDTLDKYYLVKEPEISDQEKDILARIQASLISSIDITLDQLEGSVVDSFLKENIDRVIAELDLNIDEKFMEKILYYTKRKFVGYDRIDPLMRDPHIEDISCDGSEVPVFLYHRKHGSLKSNIKFDNETELSAFVIKLAQKCDKYISIAEPMLDATMPDGSRIQMTLSNEVTTKGSTFTIRKFRSDPITPTDLIDYNTMSSEMIAYLWIAVEHGINALIAGGTAAGKTSTLNALSLFIPHGSKIVSIEETREINLPHPNWIPGVARSGFGEVIGDKVVGEIDLYDLMKAALRQRPEYILVGEIRGKEAYVLFQAMATGHTTYSTFHADSAQSLIHRLESKPIDIPRVMLQSLDIITIQISTKINDRNVRRCKKIIELIDIDPSTKEILTNEVFRWDPIEDRFIYSGKSYIMERIRAQHGKTKEEMREEIVNRVKILNWMRKNNIRAFKDVANTIISYSEKREELMNKISTGDFEKKSEFQENIETNVKQLDPEKNIRLIQDLSLNSPHKKISAFLRFKK
ncbi:MAG: type II/IV secretion system ATPase subunit [Candidatus Thermoplasmatota archaeon]|nr:type II/IV secretion system ATPase subunit [Candidatus Thermoplasmatota archaeon]